MVMFPSLKTKGVMNAVDVNAFTPAPEGINGRAQILNFCYRKDDRNVTD